MLKPIFTSLYLIYSKVVSWATSGTMVIKNIYAMLHRMIATNESPTRKTIAFENKYIQKVRSRRIEADILNQRNPTNPSNIVMEQTPRGHVIMKYNADTHTFEYYTDSGTIPQRYLETVCRKYVIIFNCTHLYVDVFEDYANAKLQQTHASSKSAVGQHNPPIYIKPSINKFVRCGRLSDFSILKTVINKQPNPSYAEFKKIKNKK